MSYNSTSEHAVGFLLSLIEDEDAARVRRRVGLPAGPDGSPAVPHRLDAGWGHTGGCPGV
ncbi:hypothetical protein ACIG0D_05760 [Streptomyces sp. NPDC052773]|uniref:hypothetical protein n=1 Tax=Streptomyces sp. NPDC052773 TaxID=3365693 RepID=UPI0037D8BF80